MKRPASLLVVMMVMGSLLLIPFTLSQGSELFSPNSFENTLEMIDGAKWMNALFSPITVIIVSFSPTEDQEKESTRGVLQVQPTGTAQYDTDNTLRPRLLETYNTLPLHFEANRGQADPAVKFLSRGDRYTLFLTPSEAVFFLRQTTDINEKVSEEPGASSAGWTTLRMKLVGANPEPHIVGVDELQGKANYFIGNDPGKWRTNVRTYVKVRYEQVYPGIDMVFYGNQGELEYDFIVSPGADPSAIALSVEGTDSLAIDDKGDLVLSAAGAQIRQRKPRVYQNNNGALQEIAGRYVLNGNSHVSFRLGAYDPTRPLIIDPVLVYSTYLGGSSDEDPAWSIAVDADGNAYVTGATRSTDFPIADSFQPVFGGGGSDAFVTKINAIGTLVYSTYVGGSGGDQGHGITVDVDDNVYVTGDTSSANFPTMNPFHSVLNGSSDAFVMKLNPDGAIVYSTYLGGSSWDTGVDIAVDVDGDAYVTGSPSSDFPVTPGALHIPNLSLFTAKINPEGSALVYSAIGVGGDVAIAVDPAGNAYVAGSTTASYPVPTTPGAFQPTYSCPYPEAEGYVMKLNSEGSALVYSTYLGEQCAGGYAGDDNVWDIAADAEGNAYVVGETESIRFPTTPGAFKENGGGVFVTKLNPNGSSLVYSTFLGGGEGFSIAIDQNGSAYVTGSTPSTNFPMVDAFQPTLGGCSDAFVTKLNPTGSALVYSTYLGGSDCDYGWGISVDSVGNAYVSGRIISMGFEDFPLVNPLQPGYGGGTEAFVAKIGTGEHIEIPLQTGWNLISIPFEMVDNSVPAVLSAIDGQYTQVVAYINGEWLTYDLAAPPSENTLTEITPEYGYWIKMSEGSTLRLAVMPPETIGFGHLVPGWNLIGYPDLAAQPVEEFFSPIMDDVERVLTYDTFDVGNEWKSYDPDKPPFLNTLTTVKPGFGYWVKIKENSSAARGTVDITVTDDETGTLVRGTQISILDQENQVVASGSGGSAVFELPAGSYTASVTAIGYYPAQQDFTIIIGQTTELEIQLVKNAASSSSGEVRTVVPSPSEEPGDIQPLLPPEGGGFGMGGR